MQSRKTHGCSAGSRSCNPHHAAARKRLTCTPFCGRKTRTTDFESFLRRAGELVKISDELHYDKMALASIELRVGQAIAERGPLGASNLKVIGGGISRKWAIPLFEYLDKQKVTIRQGDLRKLHPAYELVSST